MTYRDTLIDSMKARGLDNPEWEADAVLNRLALDGYEIVRSSPSQVAPAYPAQMTDAVAEALVLMVDAFLSRNGGSFPMDEVTKEQRLWKKAMKAAYAVIGQPRTRERDEKLAALTAAIGAGGQAVAWRFNWPKPDGSSEEWTYTEDEQHAIDLAADDGQVQPLYAHPAPSGQAVADSLWVPAKPEHKKIGWTYDFDQTERLSRAAEKATGYEGTMEVIEFVMAEADRRHKSALSQPHPADERVVEALKRLVERAQELVSRSIYVNWHDDAVKALAATEGR